MLLFYLEGRGEEVLQEPELDRGLGVLEDRQHHYSRRERKREREKERERERERNEKKEQTSVVSQGKKIIKGVRTHGGASAQQRECVCVRM